MGAASSRKASCTWVRIESSPLFGISSLPLVGCAGGPSMAMNFFLRLTRACLHVASVIFSGMGRNVHFLPGADK